MNFQNIVFKVEDRKALIAINRPDVLNALNAQTMDELESAIEAIENDESTGVVVVTGVGEKAFVAGADINELQILDGPNGKGFAQRGQNIFKRLEDLSKPVIAAINGYALGGGCELALACHIRIASENASLGQPEVNLGVIPGYGGTQRLPRVVGSSMALQMILTGQVIDANEAFRIGLVNRVVPPDELIPTVDKLAQTILSRGPVAVRQALYAVKYGTQVSLSEGLDIEANLFGDVCNTEDKTEGTTAFLEKRKPEFKNK
jgi:enoyl-CoA hydratase